MLIHIPTPGTGGYANLGDGILLTGAFLLPFYPGVAAAAIGSMLADLLAGYMVYAPGTLIVKGCTALIAMLIYRASSSKISSTPLRLIVAAVPAEIFMAAGYLLYESIFLGYGAAALASVPANLAQGFVGCIVSLLLTSLLSASHEFNDLIKKLY